MNPIKCFLLIPSDTIDVKLRRYHGKDPDCPQYGYHDAIVQFGTAIQSIPPANEYDNYDDLEAQLRPANDDPRWPVKCDHCDFIFPEEATRQMFMHRMYMRTDTSEKMTLRDAPAGALWYATWYHRRDGSGLYGWEWDNLDTPPLICRCPGNHDWDIDGRASNCDMQDDRTHRCWVRHGDPPNIHVDKNGHTCHAGAGSILAGSWHGFLHNGYLVS